MICFLELQSPKGFSAGRSVLADVAWAASLRLLWEFCLCFFPPASHLGAREASRLVSPRGAPSLRTSLWVRNLHLPLNFLVFSKRFPVKHLNGFASGLSPLLAPSLHLSLKFLAFLKRFFNEALENVRAASGGVSESFSRGPRFSFPFRRQGCSYISPWLCFNWGGAERPRVAPLQKKSRDSLL